MRANQEGWQERLQQALVKLPPTPLVVAAEAAQPVEPSGRPWPLSPNRARARR